MPRRCLGDAFKTLVDVSCVCWPSWLAVGGSVTRKTQFLTLCVLQPSGVRSLTKTQNGMCFQWGTWGGRRIQLPTCWKIVRAAQDLEVKDRYIGVLKVKGRNCQDSNGEYSFRIGKRHVGNNSHWTRELPEQGTWWVCRVWIVEAVAGICMKIENDPVIHSSVTGVVGLGYFQRARLEYVKT